MNDPTSWENESSGPGVTQPFGFRDFIRFFWSNSLILAIGLTCGVIVGLEVHERSIRIYESVGKFVVDSLPQNQSTKTTDAETERQLVQTLILSVPSREMRKAVESRLGLAPGQMAFGNLDLPAKFVKGEVVANVEVTAIRNSRMGEIKATSQSPEFAATVANAILEELESYNLVGGRLANLQFSIELGRNKADSILKQLVEISGKRIKLEKENAELSAYVKSNLPLQTFPTFSTDATLNNLKTQLILVESEFRGIASSSTRGQRLEGKKAELGDLQAQVTRHSQFLAQALRSELEIMRTQEAKLQSELQTTRNEVDMMTEKAAKLAQTFGDPGRMAEVLRQQTDAPPGPANIIVVVDRAAPKLKPVKPKLALNLAMGIALGGALALGIAILRFTLDNRLKSSENVSRLTGQPCLAMLPRHAPLAQAASNNYAAPNADYPIGLGFLRNHLLQPGENEPGAQIMGFTPCDGRGDSTTLVADLALLLAEAEKRTLIVDLHLSKPRIGNILAIEVKTGFDKWFEAGDSLSNYVSYSALKELALLAVAKPQPRLDTAFSKRPLAGGILAIAGEWDYILINSPNFLTDWNLLLALPQGKSLMITAEYARSRTDDVLETLMRARAPRWKVEGVVLQNCPKHLTRGRS